MLHTVFTLAHILDVFGMICADFIISYDLIVFLSAILNPFIVITVYRLEA